MISFFPLTLLMMMTLTMMVPCSGQQEPPPPQPQPQPFFRGSIFQDDDDDDGPMDSDSTASQRQTVLNKFPNIFDFVRQPFGNGSDQLLFSSGLNMGDDHQVGHDHGHHHDHGHGVDLMDHEQVVDGSNVHHTIMMTNKEPHRRLVIDVIEPYRFEPILDLNLTTSIHQKLQEEIARKINEVTLSHHNIPPQLPTPEPLVQGQSSSSGQLPSSSVDHDQMEPLSQESKTSETQTQSPIGSASQLVKTNRQPKDNGGGGPRRPYSFAYVVNNKNGNNFSQKETSDGNNISGSYRVLLPDGRTQTVIYMVDGKNGYNAVVTYEKSAKYSAASSPSPVIAASASASASASSSVSVSTSENSDGKIVKSVKTLKAISSTGADSNGHGNHAGHHDVKIVASNFPPHPPPPISRPYQYPQYGVPNVQSPFVRPPIFHFPEGKLQHAHPPYRQQQQQQSQESSAEIFSSSSHSHNFPRYASLFGGYGVPVSGPPPMVHLSTGPGGPRGHNSGPLHSHPPPPQSYRHYHHIRINHPVPTAAAVQIPVYHPPPPPPVPYVGNHIDKIILHPHPPPHSHTPHGGPGQSQGPGPLSQQQILTSYPLKMMNHHHIYGPPPSPPPPPGGFLPMKSIVAAMATGPSHQPPHTHNNDNNDPAVAMSQHVGHHQHHSNDKSNVVTIPTHHQHRKFKTIHHHHHHHQKIVPSYPDPLLNSDYIQAKLMEQHFAHNFNKEARESGENQNQQQQQQQQKQQQQSQRDENQILNTAHTNFVYSYPVLPKIKLNSNNQSSKNQSQTKIQNSYHQPNQLFQQQQQQQQNQKQEEGGQHKVEEMLKAHANIFSQQLNFGQGHPIVDKIQELRGEKLGSPPSIIPSIVPPVKQLKSIRAAAAATATIISPQVQTKNNNVPTIFNKIDTSTTPNLDSNRQQEQFLISFSPLPEPRVRMSRYTPGNGQGHDPPGGAAAADKRLDHPSHHGKDEKLTTAKTTTTESSLDQLKLEQHLQQQLKLQLNKTEVFNSSNSIVIMTTTTTTEKSIVNATNGPNGLGRGRRVVKRLRKKIKKT